MKVSFITTVLNEESTVSSFFKSLFLQSRLPDEIIIVDGGSLDKTVELIEKLMKEFKKYNKKTRIEIAIQKGNRSVGRNKAIKISSGDIICCSDSGNILDREWIKTIIKPFQNSDADVVAGYYKGIGGSVFERCLIPYVLVMEDKVDPKNFLPATRSVAFTKKIWEKVGGFDEKFSHNEDYVFAKKLRKIGAKIVFARDAIVYWTPRKYFRDAFYMFYRFARGDAESKIIRPKVLLIFLRYFLAFALIDIFITFHTVVVLQILIVLFIGYILWSIWKNYKYVKNWRAIYLLPALQFTSDAAILVGSTRGFF